jgi:hypothetical protein
MRRIRIYTCSARTSLSPVLRTSPLRPHTAMREGPEAFRPFNGPSGMLLQPQWEALHRAQATCGSRSCVRLAPTGGDTSWKLKAPTRGMQPSSASMPSSPLMTPAQSRANVIAPASSAAHAARPLLGWTLFRSCIPWRSRTEVQTALRHRLGLPVLPLNAPAVQCGCGATLRRSDADHAMRCRALAAQLTLRHDILKGILRRAVHRAGIASALEPALRRLPGLAAGSGTTADGSATRVEARGDILKVLPRGIAIANVSVVHPLSTHLLHRAASTAGAAASHRDRQKRATYDRWRRVATSGYQFVPVSVLLLSGLEVLRAIIFDKLTFWLCCLVGFVCCSKRYLYQVY